MKFNQGIYTFCPKDFLQFERNEGLGVAASSSSDAKVLKLFKRCGQGKDYLIPLQAANGFAITETMEYDKAENQYIYTAVRSLGKRRETKERTNYLVHIAVPKEDVSFEPSLYLRKMHWEKSAFIQNIEEIGSSRLEPFEAPLYGFHYDEIMEKYGLYNIRRLAWLLARLMESLFQGHKRRLVCIMRGCSTQEEYQNMALEITYLFHSWIPQQMQDLVPYPSVYSGYCITDNPGHPQNCLMFVPESTEPKMEDSVFDFTRCYAEHEIAESEQAIACYRFLAAKAQTSLEEIRSVLEEFCSYDRSRMPLLRKVYDRFEQYKQNHRDEFELCSLDMLFQPPKEENLQTKQRQERPVLSVFDFLALTEEDRNQNPQEYERLANCYKEEIEQLREGLKRYDQINRQKKEISVEETLKKDESADRFRLLHLLRRK